MPLFHAPHSLFKCIDECKRFLLLLRLFRFQVSQFNWYRERKRKMKNLSGIPITGGVRWKINRGRAWKRLMTLRILAPISHGSLVTRNAPSTIIESGTNKKFSGVTHVKQLGSRTFVSNVKELCFDPNIQGYYWFKYVFIKIALHDFCW